MKKIFKCFFFSAIIFISSCDSYECLDKDVYKYTVMQPIYGSDGKRMYVITYIPQEYTGCKHPIYKNKGG